MDGATSRRPARQPSGSAQPALPMLSSYADESTTIYRREHIRAVFSVQYVEPLILVKRPRRLDPNHSSVVYVASCVGLPR